MSLAQVYWENIVLSGNNLIPNNTIKLDSQISGSVVNASADESPLVSYLRI